MAKEPGTLIIIGGGEDRHGEKKILQHVAQAVGDGQMVIATVASHEPEGYFPMYEKAFNELGVKDLCEIYINSRTEAYDEKTVKLLDNVKGVFFTGGDQLRITSQIDDTPVMHRIHEIYQAGGVIAGTSAGASAMCETMLVRGTSRESSRIGDLQMAPGLGIISDVIIDQHFAQRGRMGRLLGAVAHNPRIIGIGIDEDTGIMFRFGCFKVIGNGAVYVVDGERVTYNSVAEERYDRALSIHDVRLHVLSEGDSYDLASREPSYELVTKG
jgi:cyanophycinase